jgi:hypothetical protein
LGSSSLLATAGSAAAGHYDLLTVVAHEMGHLLGFHHTNAEHLMAPMLSPGVRHLPESLPTDGHPATGRRDSANRMAIAGEDSLLVDADPLTLPTRGISFVPVRRDAMHELRLSAQHPGLSMSLAAADKVFADHANHHHLVTLGDQRKSTSNYDDFVMAYECLPVAAKYHLIDIVYDQFGNAFTELDDLDWSNRLICDFLPNERRRN